MNVRYRLGAIGAVIGRDLIDRPVMQGPARRSVVLVIGVYVSGSVANHDMKRLRRVLMFVRMRRRTRQDTKLRHGDREHTRQEAAKSLHPILGLTPQWLPSLKGPGPSIPQIDVRPQGCDAVRTSRQNHPNGALPPFRFSRSRRFRLKPPQQGR
jgi:hypothetical protein